VGAGLSARCWIGAFGPAHAQCLQPRGNILSADYGDTYKAA
jgi:hypothetical protein